MIGRRRRASTRSTAATPSSHGRTETVVPLQCCPRSSMTFDDLQYLLECRSTCSVRVVRVILRSVCLVSLGQLATLCPVRLLAPRRCLLETNAGEKNTQLIFSCSTATVRDQVLAPPLHQRWAWQFVLYSLHESERNTPPPSQKKNREVARGPWS